MLKKGRNKKCSLGGFSKKAFFRLLSIIFLGICFWSMFFSSHTRLKKVEIITSELDRTKLDDISNKYRSEFWFKYFSKNNFFLFPKKSFSKLAKEQFKIIREVNFKNEFPNSIIIEIEERTDLMIWCNREKCFLIDETGLVFYQLQEGEKDQDFFDYNIIIDKSNLEFEVGQKIEEGRLVSFVSEVENLLKKELDIEIQRESETPSVISGEIRIKTKDGWHLYFSTKNKPATQVKLLKEVLKTSIGQKEKEELNYIDLRIADKAIYNSSFRAIESEIEK